MKLIVLSTLFAFVSSVQEYGVDRPKNLKSNCGWWNLESDVITYPWVVGILSNVHKDFLCSGTILTKWHVLTTAFHLESRHPGGIQVCTGTKEMKKCKDNGEIMDVQEILFKDGFNSEKSRNNLAIILLLNEFEFNKYLGPACFFREKMLNDQLFDTELMFLGWGGSKLLKRIDFRTKAEGTCKPRYVHFTNAMHICAASDSAQNVLYDGGGAFFILDKDTDRYTVVGVLDSYPRSVETPPGPSIVTNITTFRWWAKWKVWYTRRSSLCKKNKKKNLTNN